MLVSGTQLAGGGGGLATMTGMPDRESSLLKQRSNDGHASVHVRHGKK
jgi:hypothetical protein